jgi:hypothetical protein
LLGVKHRLLGLHLLHQFFDPINRKLVGDGARYAFVVPDLAVEFHTLVTHFRFRFYAYLAVIIGYCLYDGEAALRFTMPPLNSVGQFELWQDDWLEPARFRRIFA